jgi:hypothetical protein
VFVSANEVVLLPKNPKLVIVKAAVPEFCSVATCAVLVVPTVRLPKLMVAGVSTGCGADAPPSPVPLSVMAPPPELPSRVVGLVTSVPESVNGPADGGVNV